MVAQNMTIEFRMCVLGVSVQMFHKQDWNPTFVLLKMT